VAATTFVLWSRYELELPKALWSLLLLPLLAALYLWRIRRRGGEVKLPTLSVLSKGPVDVLARLRHLPFALGLCGLGVLLASLSRPQSKDKWQDVTKEGIDIIIAMDFSASMLAKDFKPDRLTAAREVAMRFIDDRPNDRIGLVVYEGEAFTQCPLTTDHKVLQNLFLQAKRGLITGGTAVGTGLATAINRLRDSDGKSKVVILLTDGVNNAGTITRSSTTGNTFGLFLGDYTVARNNAANVGGTGTGAAGATTLRITPSGTLTAGQLAGKQILMAGEIVDGEARPGDLRTIASATLVSGNTYDITVSGGGWSKNQAGNQFNLLAGDGPNRVVNAGDILATYTGTATANVRAIETNIAGDYVITNTGNIRATHTSIGTPQGIDAGGTSPRSPSPTAGSSSRSVPRPSSSRRTSPPPSGRNRRRSRRRRTWARPPPSSLRRRPRKPPSSTRPPARCGASGASTRPSTCGRPSSPSSTPA
jgi:hypothetical protein